MYNFMMGVFLISGLLMILLVMLRKGEGMSLSGTFGGMGGDSAFGVKAQKHLDKIISYFSIIFVVSAILLNTPTFRKEKSTTPDKDNTTKQQTESQDTPNTPEENK